MVIGSIYDAKGKRDPEIAQLPEAIANAVAEMANLEGFQRLKPVEFYNRCMNKELTELQARVRASNLPMDFHDLVYPALHRKALVLRIEEGSGLWQVTEEGRKRLLQMIAAKEEVRRGLESRLQAARKSREGPSIQTYLHQLAVDAAKARIKELRRSLEEVPPKPPKAVAPVPPVAALEGPPALGNPAGLVAARPKSALEHPQQPEPRRPKAPKGEIGGADLLAESSETFMLQGALGAFIGRMDRKMAAIGLTGDSGSGKSTFSLTLAGLFARHGFTVKYFSLEEGLGDSMKRKIRAAGIGNDVRFAEGASLHAIRQDARRFDVVFIDSYTILDAGQDELERLRKDFPETIFVCIHQKTTGGTIRGGTKIFYNSTAIINIEIDHDRGRLAVMKKSRYGTEGFMYNINDDEVFRAGDW